MSTQPPREPSPSSPQSGDLVAGKYLLGRELGRGGMGIVFEATNTMTERRFALKWLALGSDEAVSRFQREAKLASRVRHPNVVDVYDMHQDSAGCFLVMELLEGECLADVLAQKGALSLDAACEIILQCLSGVAAAHAVGVIHRDLKPDNIFLCQGQGGASGPKLLDFGISQPAPSQPEAASSEITGPCLLAGTPSFMAPEQLSGSPCDERTDLYALGLTFYAMLAGSDAYPAATYERLSAQIMEGAFEPLSQRAPHVPSAVSEVIARAIDRAPEARFPSAVAFASAIEAARAQVARPVENPRAQSAWPIENPRTQSAWPIENPRGRSLERPSRPSVQAVRPIEDPAAAPAASEPYVEPLTPLDSEPIAVRKVDRTWAKLGLLVSAGALAGSLAFIAMRPAQSERATRRPSAPIAPAAGELASIAPPATTPPPPARERLRLKVAPAPAPASRAVPDVKPKRSKPARAPATEARPRPPAEPARDAEDSSRVATSSLQEKPQVTIGSM